MRVRALQVGIAVFWLAGAGEAVTLKAGLSHVNGTFEYGQTDYNAKGTPTTNKSEPVSVGVVSLAVASLNPVTEHIAAGFEVGVSMSGKYAFDNTKAYNPAAGSPNGNEGDSETYEFTRIPLLLRGDASLAVGPGRARVGLGVGSVIVAWSRVVVRKYWTDSTGFGFSSDKSVIYSTEAQTNTDYETTLSSLFDIEITPGYNYPLGEKDMVGIEMPLAIVTKAIVMGGEAKMNPAPANGSSNPAITTPKMTLGGFGWGVAVSWTHQL